MDDKGSIQHFKDENEALKHGYKHTLSEVEAMKMGNLPEAQRVMTLHWDRFIGSRKVSTIEKIKMRQAFEAAWKAAKS